MCMMSGSGAYNPPRVKKAPDPEPGPASPPDMVNNQVIPNANDRAGQEAARNEFDPKLKSQSSKY